jgi:aminoglycoside 6'-N-acetyltransferase
VLFAMGRRASACALTASCHARAGQVQSWAHAEVDHTCRDQPIGTRGIDQFIGEPEFIGRGHGSTFIRAFVERLFETGAPRAVTDPNPGNARAIRAYTKAGFRPIDTRLTISGQALLMACDVYTNRNLAVETL